MKVLTLGIAILLSMGIMAQHKSEPKVIVTPVHGGFLYMGIPNALDAMAEGLNCDQVTISATHADTEGNGCRYTIYPDSVKYTEISVFSIKANDTVYLRSQGIRVKPLPPPTAHIYFKSSGKMSRYFLINGKMEADLGRIGLCSEGIDFTVVSFDMRNLSVPDKSYSTKGNKLSDEMIRALQSAEVGDVIRFENIRSHLGRQISDCISFELELQ